ncbi:hypothetical protein HB780_18605 [Rhizobium lusitanum]|jgi:hypothetical protein|uniref:hypothetical protein n=1 Tax=Rhizobium lusitanum TaxID=293958 RepID=UPI0013AF718F|nr:hypothetical protein [Rhizobium lusitanum]QND47687.1 hypothetical protein HB780_18605 [Rhizobium lusitanum]
MYLSKHAFSSATLIDADDIDFLALPDLMPIPVDEEIARLICSVSNRPGRHGL